MIKTMEMFTSTVEGLRLLRNEDNAPPPRLTLEAKVAKLASEIGCVALDMQELARREARLTRELKKKVAKLEAVSK